MADSAASTNPPPRRSDTVDCRVCDGSGRLGERACPACGGTGRVETVAGAPGTPDAQPRPR